MLVIAILLTATLASFSDISLPYVTFIVLSMMTVITSATPLVYASLGELITEKAGCLNLGVEGMMIVGAISGFASAVTTGSGILGILAGALAGCALSLVFALLVLGMKANQVASGLALTIFGLGLSALVGSAFVGKAFVGLPKMDVNGIISALPVAAPLFSTPVIGKLLFGHDGLVYGSFLLFFAVNYLLTRTRLGLVLRAVGENHDAAHAIGYPVRLIRLGAIAFGGACAGVGGAYLSLAYTPLWVEGMTAGRGWIALALVVFAAWRPARALIGAYLFGGITIIQLHVQGFGIGVPPQIMSMMPYLITIAVLIFISSQSGGRALSAPACLGRNFYASN